MADVFGISSGGGDRTWWQHTNPEKDDFSTVITGDVVEIRATPHYIWGTQEIDRWPSGDPKIDMQFCLACPDGEERWFSIKKYNKSSRTNYWSTLQLKMFEALKNAGLPGASVTEFGGLNITVSTIQPPDGFGYGPGNPRRYNCVVNGRGTAPFRGSFDKVSELSEKKATNAATADMMAASVAARPVSSQMENARAKAAQAMNIQFEEIPGVYDQDIPF